MRGRKVLISFLALTLSCSGPGGNGNGGDPLFSDLGVGFGDRFFWDFYGKDGSVIWMSVHDLLLDENIDTNYADIDRFDPVAFKNLQGYLRNSRFLVFWLTKGWRESWFDIDQLNVLMSAGYVPVFMYWYFGDSLDGVPSTPKLKSSWRTWTGLSLFLRKLKGRKIPDLRARVQRPGYSGRPRGG
ncbi:MAG: hypothetical protein Q9N34_08575 [Aquificota bacterium]|nr:hypothetical protein [Aquificota bacterium]